MPATLLHYPLNIQNRLQTGYEISSSGIGCLPFIRRTIVEVQSIDTGDLRPELAAIHSDIMDATPVAALEKLQRAIESVSYEYKSEYASQRA